MLGAVRWMATGFALGLATDRVWLELRKPAAEQFPWLRRRMNETVNPWLLEHGIPGSSNAEIATLEHVGRRSGTCYFTPVHPTFREDGVYVPAPLGVGSQWARNVLRAGRARLQFHETLYELDQPVLMTVTEAGMVPASVAAPFDRMGWRYVRLHVAATVAGTFATHARSVRAPDGRPVVEPPLEGAYEIPVVPKQVERQPAPA